MIEGKTYRVTAREPDQNKSTKRALAMAVSIAYAPPTRVPAKQICSTHLGGRCVHLVWSEMNGNLLRTNTLQPGEGKMEVCCAVVVRCPKPLLFPPLSLPPPNPTQPSWAVASAAATAVASAVAIAFAAAFTAALTSPPLSPPSSTPRSPPPPTHRRRNFPQCSLRRQ